MENLWQCLLCALFCPVLSEPSTRVDLDFIIWSWKEVERTATGASWKVLGNLRTPISGGPVDGLEGGQKGLNDVEAKGVPRQFMARERTVMKQNFWASRPNSRESEIPKGKGSQELSFLNRNLSTLTFLRKCFGKC